MNKFLKDILISSKYESKKESLNLWGNLYEHFILMDYDEISFLNFFKSELTDNVISQFQELKDDKIKKNTSIFILLKVDNLKDFYEQNINTIMKIEEDEYYFRKYVILYTETSLAAVLEYNNAKKLIEYISSEKDQEANMFEFFEKNMFFDESYFLAMQLVIKLPFISLPHAEQQYEPIETKINAVIEKKDLRGIQNNVDEIIKMFANNSSTLEISKKIMNENNIFKTLNKLFEE